MEEEREEFFEDDWLVDFRIFEVGDFVNLILVYKLLIEEESKEILERKSNEFEREEDKYVKKEFDVVDILKIIFF